MNTWDRVERLIGKDNLERLGNSRVGVIGLGSGGGFVALSLAMSGVGHFTLVDDDTLENTNVVRHVADLRDVGRNKAQVTADLIKQRNPNATVEVYEGRIEQHMNALDDLDILVVGVDGENSKYTINAACLERGLTAVYAGVYERGEGGDVVIIRPGNGPCYSCWAVELREGVADAAASAGAQDGEVEELDYGMIGESGTLEAEPGLWVHVAKVAAIQTDFVLNELLKGTHSRREFPANTVILTNNVAMEIITDQITPPHSSVWVNIHRDPNCLVCGDLINAEQSEDSQPFTLNDLAGDSGITIEGDSDEPEEDTAGERRTMQNHNKTSSGR